MAKMSKVRCLKLEVISADGGETDYGPTECDPQNDLIDCAGVALQANGSNDATCIITRHPESGQMQIQDTVTGAGGAVALSTIGQVASGGPSQPFFYEVIGSPMAPSAEIYWADQARTKKINQIRYLTTDPGASLLNPSPVVTEFFGADGQTITQRMTDTCTFTGPFLLTRTRTVETP